jgi:hypothetical protein
MHLITSLFFIFGVNVRVKINLSIDNFILLKINAPKRILYGKKVFTGSLFGLMLYQSES